MDNVSLNLVEHWDEAQSFMSGLGVRRPILACDTETGGLDWWRDELRLVQFGDLSTGWVIPWQLWGGLAKEALSRYTGDIAFHNMKFDLKYLEHNGCVLRRDKLHDTRSMAHLLDPISPTGLKPLGVRYVDAGADTGQSALKKGMTQSGWTWATVPVDYQPYWLYSALDPVLTAHLYQKFRPQIVGGLDDVYELEVACIFVLNDMERRGARVDIPYCVEKQGELLEYAGKAREWVQATFGFGAGSNKQIAAHLQKEGIILTKRTDSGAWSMDESVLSGIDHPLAQTVLNVRRTEKMGKSYFGNYIGMADGELLHPDVNPLGARTGRMSVSRPALQQIPRTKLLRDPFIPREGNKLLSVDFDQVEMRLLAHFSEDAGLLAAFAAEGDFFEAMARQVFPDAENLKQARQHVKTVSYAKVYGSGVETMAGTLGESLSVAQHVLNLYDRAFPGVQLFMQKLTRSPELTPEGLPFVTSPLGRRHPCERYAAYKLVNYLIQGTAADIFKQTLVDLDRAGLSQYLILPVHDEAVFDVPEAEADELARAAVEVFSSDKWAVPLTAGSDIVDRWGDKYA